MSMLIESTIGAAVAELKRGFKGELLTPDAAHYEEARQVYNAMIDRRPALIARCADADDAAAAIKAARKHGLTVAVRGGGHNAAGLGVWDGALVVDLSAMRSVEVDRSGQTIRTEGGCTWADVDKAGHPKV